MKRNKRDPLLRPNKGALPLGSLIGVKCRTGPQSARVVDVQALSQYAETPNAYTYYIHFEGCNRRLDQWVTYDTIIKEWNEVANRPAENGDFILHDEHEGLDAKQLAVHEESTKVRRIEYLEMGNNRCKAWYFSPFPEHFQDLETIFACQFCLNAFKHSEEMQRHTQRCKVRHPPGNEIYRDQGVSVFEVDGAVSPLYCENLAFIAKLFLDHKTLAFDVNPFLFYVLTEKDDQGWRFVGYFSKEKESDQDYNLACILVFPFIQRSGYGKFLISLSYQLSRIEKKKGTPERPLSDLGFRAYIKWWAEVLVAELRNHANEVLSIEELSDLTYIKEEDIIMTLEKLRILRYETSGNWRLYANASYLDQVQATLGPPGRVLRPEKLHWLPRRVRSVETLKTQWNSRPGDQTW
jgi:hypothetical protein